MVSVKHEMEQPGGVVGGEPHLIEDLALAAIMGDIHEVRRLEEQHPGLVDARDHDGITAIRTACMATKHEIVAYLLDKGADINQQDEGFSLLQEVLWKNDMALFNLLLERGPSLLMVDSGGYNILLAYSSAKRQVDAVVALLELEQVRGAINTETASGATALSRANDKGHSKIVKLLLEAGADPHLGNYSCLNMARAEGHSECVKLLEVSLQRTKPCIILGL